MSVLRPGLGRAIAARTESALILAPAERQRDGLDRRERRARKLAKHKGGHGLAEDGGHRSQHGQHSHAKARQRAKVRGRVARGLVIEERKQLNACRLRRVDARDARQEQGGGRVFCRVSGVLRISRGHQRRRRHWHCCSQRRDGSRPCRTIGSQSCVFATLGVSSVGLASAVNTFARPGRGKSGSCCAA
jgi:hypothetical protein